MNSLVFKHILRFFGFILAQILILNNIFFWGYLNPFVYVLFLLLLPHGISRNLSLVIAFFTGLIIDMFMNSMGIHIFSCVLIMYLRNYVIYAIVPQLKNKKHDLTEISLSEFGIQNTIIYSVILIFIHHTTLFALEEFSFDLLNILTRTILSSIASSILIITLQFLLFSKS